MKIHCRYDELVPVSDLKPFPKNRNQHSEDQITRLAKLLEYQGIRAPIVCTREKVIAKGHGTLEAIRKNGGIQAPVVYQDFENEDQLYAFVQSDNAIQTWADLDLAGINSDLPDLGPDFDLDMLGIKDFVLDPADKTPGCDEDDAPEAPKEPRTKSGDLYVIGNHRLMCGDSTNAEDVERLMDGNKADMVFTDPPYGVNYQEKNKMLNRLQPSLGRLETAIHGDDMSLDQLKLLVSGAFRNIAAVLADKSSYYVTAPQGGELGLMMMMQEACIPCRHMIIWVKNNAAFSMGRLDYDYRHEPILYGWPQGKTHSFHGGGEFKNSVWEIDREPNKLHPTMKPVALIEEAILNSSLPGQRVFDAFCGSGSTLVACEKTSRLGIGMEIDENYCDVIVSRLCEFSGITRVKLNGQDIDWTS